MKKNIFFNCSTNIVGGGVKNSALFIKYSFNDEEINWFYAISKPVNDLLQNLGIDTSVDNFFVIDSSPSKSITSRKKLQKIVNSLEIDCIYTMAGPAYISFKKPHFLGLSNPYITHADFSSYFLKPGLFQKLKQIINILYQIRHSLNSDYYIFQTDYAKNSFCKRYLINKEKTCVISNAFDTEFSNYPLYSNLDIPNSSFNIFCPAGPFIHKNIHNIPDLVNYILKKNPNLKFKFIITLNENTYIFKLINKKINKYNISNYITNIGNYSYNQSYSLYKKSDIVLIPSILETFTITYLEAMATNRPLIVADKQFAREVCKDSALYININNHHDSYNTILKLMNDPSLRNELVHKGKIILNNYKDHSTRYNNITRHLLSKI